MRIAYLSNSRFPSERAHMVQIVHMCNAFCELGHTVTLVVTDRQTEIIEKADDFYGVPILFAVKRIAIPDIVGNIKIFPRILWPYLYSIQLFIFAFKARIYIKRDDFDFSYIRDYWVVLISTIFSKNKVIWESHEAKYNLVVRFLIKKLDKIIVISEGIRDFYISKGFSKDSLFVAHDGIDDSFFKTPISKHEIRKKLGISSKLPVVMYIGGFDKWKGVDTLFELAKSTINEFSVYVIGGTEEVIEKYKEKFPNVHFLGAMPYRDLHNNQQSADILVIPNTAKNKLSAEYTSPLKLFAYMTSKLPIVASDIKSLRNVLGNNTCVYFEPDNSESLKIAINKVISDIDLRHKITDSAFELSKKYTWRSRAKDILDFIN